MKKLIIGCSLFCFIAVQASAQIPSFNKGDNVASLGIGIGGNMYSGSGIKRIPALSLYYENCVKDNLWDEKSALGIGGMLGYASAKWEDSGGLYGWKSSNIILGVRGAVHYAFADKLDTYAGLMLSYGIATSKQTGNWGTVTYNHVGGGFDLSLFLGARYYFTDTFAVFAEVGYGVTVLNLGVSLKF